MTDDQDWEEEDDERDRGLPLGSASGQIDHLLAVGQIRRATDLAVALVSQEPDSSFAHLSLARVLLVQGLYPQALDSAREAVRLAPDQDAGHSFVARALLRLGRFAESERAVLHAIELDPSDAGNHLLHARLLTICERWAPALAGVNRALELDPDDTTAHQLRATLLLHIKPRDWSLSEAAAERAVRLDPDSADAHAILGAVHQRAGRRAKAEERFRSALEIDPMNTLAIAGLAEEVMGRSPLYRPFLRYSLFMERSPLATRVALVAGLWVMMNAITAVLIARPDWAVVGGVLQLAYLAFCAYTWFATPVTRALLSRRYPWLRQAASHV